MNARKVLVRATELAAMPPASLLILDCRFGLADPGQGVREYRAAHIPGAVYASLDRDLSDLSKTGLGRHPLPDVPVFARTLSCWGWRPGMRVVAYDDNGGALAAARAWWMLRTAGIDAAVLDGGWRAWCEAGLPGESGEREVRAAPPVTLRIDTHAVVYYPELERLRTQPSTLILDARAGPRYRGEHEPLDRVPGHVPGARNRPFGENLQDGGRFKPVDVLRAEWTGVLAGHDPRDVIHMCGSGVTACHNLLAMEAVGLRGSRLFAPSWSGWVDDPARPVAVGD
ncbi:MAG TPA: sulfurtransferase [Rhodanobacteraceae bacterium]|jgi:thiosulfate/3-mercaptopyruvate sulfurtransferase|nr:sulfurtransferase [Rhodanobacteraceae bacterium]